MLEKFLNDLEKEKCNDNCPFKLRNDRPIIKIPPPKKPLMMIISRDPTINFLPLYNLSKNYNQETQRLMLFSGAIPQMLLTRMNQFLEKSEEKKNIQEFYKLFDFTYWTHFHKCPTDKYNKFDKICAGKWLLKEIKEGKKSGIQVIVTLGEHAKNWIEKNLDDEIKKEIEIISLYHPSRRAPIWDNEEYTIKIKSKIEELRAQIIRLSNK